jgi:hypothetical protein
LCIYKNNWNETGTDSTEASRILRTGVSQQLQHILTQTILRIKKLKCKNIKLSLCLTKHHVMKAFRGSGGIAPLILWPRL